MSSITECLVRFFPNMSKLFETPLPVTSAHRVLQLVITWLNHSLCRQLSPSFLLPSELLLLDDAVHDLGSGMLKDEVHKRGVLHGFFHAVIAGGRFPRGCRVYQNMLRTSTDTCSIQAEAWL